MTKRLATVVLGLAITAAAGAAAQEPALTKVRVGYDGFSMTSGPLNYATKKGLFKQFGLDVTPVWVEGGSTLTHAVVGGSIDIAQNGYTPAAAAAVQGADIVFIGEGEQTWPLAVDVPPIVPMVEDAASFEVTMLILPVDASIVACRLLAASAALRPFRVET